MAILSWVIVGALAGWIASMILKTNGQQGAVGNIIMGIIGALVGGFLAGWLFDIEIGGFNITTVLVSVVGALIFAFAMSAVTGKKHV